MFRATHWPEMHFCDEEWNDTYEEKKAENKWPRSGNVENLFRLSDQKREKNEFSLLLFLQAFEEEKFYEKNIILEWW